MLTQLVDYIMNFAGSLGYFGIIFVTSLEYACFPLPSEVVLPFIGVGIATGTYSFIKAWLASLLGGMFGSLLAYVIGYIGGVPFLNWSKRKFPKTEKTIVALDKWFNRYGSIALMITRVVPLTRTYVSILAGSQKFDLLKFMGYTALGVAAWNTILISLGYFLGDNLHLIEQIISQYSVVVGALILLAVGYWFYHKRKTMATRNH
ncbi:MAG: DedA family protein [Cellulosilyticaceae bacterium]